MWLTLTLVFALALALLIPYLIKEIRRGKAEVGPRTPTGAGDVHPGRPGNPAPGQPETTIDPYDPQARR
jgi:hypothetical protein